MQQSALHSLQNSDRKHLSLLAALRAMLCDLLCAAQFLLKQLMHSSTVLLACLSDKRGVSAALQSVSMRGQQSARSGSGRLHHCHEKLKPDHLLHSAILERNAVLIETADVMGVPVNRIVSESELVLTFEFPCTAKQLEGLTAGEVDTNQGCCNTKPMAGWILDSMNRINRGGLRTQLTRIRGMVLAKVP